MISNISFAGRYKVSTTNNPYQAFSKFQDYSAEIDDKLNYRSFKTSFDKNGYSASCTISVPDSMDKEIETYCANNGINFTRSNSLTSSEAIKKRLQDPKEGFFLAKINADALKKLIQNQQSNISHCASDYEKYYKDDVKEMIESEETIPATTLYIHSFDENNDKLIEYINRFGAENLNPNSIFVDFNQETDNPDHCTFFVLKNLGENKIPVYMNSETLKAADALGLLED